MDIGPEEEKITVEPMEDPVPTQEPVPESPPKPDPTPEPTEPVKV